MTFEQYRLNGAPIELTWDPTINPQGGRQLFIEFLANAREPQHRNGFTTPPEESVVPDNDYWSGKPHVLWSQVDRAGHYHLKLYENYGNDTYSSLEVAAQALFFLKNIRQLSFSRVYSMGGSWGAATTNPSALLMPRSFYASFGGGMLPDFPTDMPNGAFRRLVAHMQAGLNTPTWTTPSRPNTRVFQATESQVRASENIGGSDLAAFSLMRRSSLLSGEPNDLKIKVFGISANCDIHTNMHWFRPTFEANPLTAGLWSWQQFLGHGERYGSQQNQFWYFDGTELGLLLNEQTPYTGQFNPDLQPNPVIPDPYPSPYNHTLRNLPSQADYANQQSFPLLTQVSFGDAFSNDIKQIGQGVFPGLEDSMRVGDLDGGSGTEVAFGNFDGFVHVMELKTSPAGKPYLEDEWRSPPLPWGVHALDTGVLTGSTKSILAGTGNGIIYKINVQGNNTYSSPVMFHPVSITQFPSPHLGTGPLSYLFVGDFSTGANNEVLVQEEYGRWCCSATSARSSPRPIGSATPRAPTTTSGSAANPSS